MQAEFFWRFCPLIVVNLNARRIMSGNIDGLISLIFLILSKSETSIKIEQLKYVDLEKIYQTGKVNEIQSSSITLPITHYIIYISSTHHLFRFGCPSFFFDPSFLFPYSFRNP